MIYVSHTFVHISELSYRLVLYVFLDESLSNISIPRLFHGSFRMLCFFICLIYVVQLLTIFVLLVIQCKKQKCEMISLLVPIRVL